MKNRTLIGIMCIIVAFAIIFGISPMVNKMTEGKTEVVSFSKNISHGAKLTDDDIQTVKIAKSALPEKAIKDKKEVLGKFANSDLYKGDIATPAKLTDDANSADNILSALSKDKVAMSVTISSFAGGLSGKLQNGDIISFCITGKDGKTEIPPELKYVRVITTTTSGGVDENEVVPNEDGSFDLPTTITVLASVKQATILANYDKNAKIHVALVYRGDEKTAQKYVDKQDKYFSDLKKAETTDGGKTNG